MTTPKKIQPILKHLSNPRHFSDLILVVGRDVLRVKGPVYDNKTHLEAAVDWLLEAFYSTEEKGFSASYSLKTGWDVHYPETTGYIIPTLLNFVLYSDYRKKEVLDACIKSGEWLLSIQMKDGSFFGYRSEQPIVFDTGQIIFGLAALYNHTKKKRFLDALERASDWICDIQEKDGSWKKYAYNNISHSYYSRVSWGLLTSYSLLKKLSYREAARKNLDWVLSCGGNSGWFKKNGFLEYTPADLHTITYTLRGLLESGLILESEKHISAAKGGVRHLLELQKEGDLKSAYYDGWVATGTNYKCLTGLAQVAIVWMQLWDLYKEQEYYKEAEKVLYFLKYCQNLNSLKVYLRGGLGGSKPIWGKYIPYAYPNWAAKFFIDLLLLFEKNNHKLTYAG